MEFITALMQRMLQEPMSTVREFEELCTCCKPQKTVHHSQQNCTRFCFHCLMSLHPVAPECVTAYLEHAGGVGGLQRDAHAVPRLHGVQRFLSG